MASRSEKSLGRASASSRALVCRHLGVTLTGGHGLDTGADDVVEDVLGHKGPAAGLAVGPQVHALRVLGVELFDNLGP